MSEKQTPNTEVKDKVMKELEADHGWTEQDQQNPNLFHQMIEDVLVVMEKDYLHKDDVREMIVQAHKKGAMCRREAGTMLARANAYANTLNL